MSTKSIRIREALDWIEPVADGPGGARLIAAARSELDDIDRSATLAWNEALEAAAETADGGPLRVRGVLMTPRERILALKRTT